MTYEEILTNAPAQDSPEFLEYLKENNTVVKEDGYWLVIENCKYHTTEKPWLTAFAKNKLMNFFLINHYWGDWEWLKKSVERQTVPGRFHVHLYRP